MIKLVLTDLDDTLIAVGSGGASARAVAAMHALTDAGVWAGPATGRQPKSMRWMFVDHPECYRTGVFANGQLLFCDGELVAAHELDHDALCRLVDFLDRETDDTVLNLYELGPDFFENEPFFVTRDPRRLAEILDPSEEFLLRAPHVDAVPEHTLYKANVRSAASREELAQVRERLRSVVPELDFVFPNAFSSMFDIVPAGWGKGAGIAELAEKIGVAFDDVMVFGDSENDLTMFDAVPNSVAVSNAMPEVAAAARWHIGASADDAVAAAFEEIARCAVAAGVPSFMPSMSGEDDK